MLDQSILPDIVDMCQKPAASSLKGKRSMETSIKNGKMMQKHHSDWKLTNL